MAKKRTIWTVRVPRGFTLIELLVVIAIIALLMAILIPVLKRAREQAKAVACLSNLKQWALATVMYAVDYDDKMWADSYAPGPMMPVGDWMRILQPYYQDIDEIRCCPIATKPCQDTHSERRGGLYNVWGTPGVETETSRAVYWGSYGLNRWVTDPGDDDERFWIRASTKYGDEIPVILDCIHWHLRPRDTDRKPDRPLVIFSDFPVDGQGGTQMWRCFVDRHHGAIHGSFLDGSVQKIPLPSLWNVRWYRGFQKQYYTRDDFPWLR